MHIAWKEPIRVLPPYMVNVHNLNRRLLDSGTATLTTVLTNGHD